MDRLEAMAVLIAVVEEGSLSAASRRLRVPLPTVSRKVTDLEKHLQTRLIVRTSRRIALTDAGRAYVAAAKEILERVDTAERIAAGEYSTPRGELRVTAPEVFGRRHLLPIALDFLEENPEITLRLFFADRQMNLVEEHMDVAVRIGHLEDSGLIAARIGTVERVICASPAYLARRGTPQTPDDLKEHDGITFRGFPIAPEWRYRKDGAAFAIEPKTRLAVNATDAAIEAALAGLGIIRVLSYQVADELKSGVLRRVLTDFMPEPLPVNLVYPDTGLLSPKLRTFLDWTAPRLRARLSSQASAA